MDRAGEQVLAAMAQAAAAEQLGLVTREQLVQAVGKWRLRGLVQGGRVLPVLTGVFAFAGTPRSRLRSFVASVLWYGHAGRPEKPDEASPADEGAPHAALGMAPALAAATCLPLAEDPVPTDAPPEVTPTFQLAKPAHRAALSHQSAAELWELQGIPEDEDKKIHVVREGRLCPTCHDSIQPHGTRALPEEEVVRHRGVPVTSALRTIVDLAACVTEHQLELAILDAVARELFTAQQLKDRVAAERRAKAAGCAALEFVVRRAGFDVITASPLEREALQVLLDAGLKPAGQHTLERLPGNIFVGVYDLVMTKEKVLIEVDSKKWHRAWKAKVRDGEKTDGAVELGYEVVRVRKRDLVDPGRRAFLRRLSAAMATAPVRAAMKWPRSRLRPFHPPRRDRQAKAA